MSDTNLPETQEKKSVYETLNDKEREQFDIITKRLPVIAQGIFALRNHKIDSISIEAGTANNDTAYYSPNERKVVFTDTLFKGLIKHAINTNASKDAPSKATEFVFYHEAFHSILTKYWHEVKSPVFSFYQNHMEDIRVNRAVTQHDRAQEANAYFAYDAIGGMRTPDKDTKKVPTLVENVSSYFSTLSRYATSTNIKNFIDSEIDKHRYTPLDQYFLLVMSTPIGRIMQVDEDLLDAREIHDNARKQYERIAEVFEVHKRIYPDNPELAKFLEDHKLTPLEELLEKLRNMHKKAVADLESDPAMKVYKAMTKEQLSKKCEEFAQEVMLQRKGDNRRALLYIDTLLRDHIRQERNQNQTQAGTSPTKEPPKQGEGPEKQGGGKGGIKTEGPADGEASGLTPGEIEGIIYTIESPVEAKGTPKKNLEELLKAQRNQHVSPDTAPYSKGSSKRGTGGLGAGGGTGEVEEELSGGDRAKATAFLRTNAKIITTMKRELATKGVVPGYSKGAPRNSVGGPFIHTTNVSLQGNFPISPQERPLFRRPSMGNGTGDTELDLDGIHILLDASGSMSGTEQILRKFGGSFFAAAREAKLPTSLVMTGSGSKLLARPLKNADVYSPVSKLISFEAGGGTDFGNSGVKLISDLIKGSKSKKQRVLGITDAILPVNDVRKMSDTFKKMEVPTIIMVINAQDAPGVELHKAVPNSQIIHLTGEPTDTQILGFFNALFQWMKEPQGFQQRYGNYVSVNDYIAQGQGKLTKSAKHIQGFER